MIIHPEIKKEIIWHPKDLHKKVGKFFYFNTNDFGDEMEKGQLYFFDGEKMYLILNEIEKSK